MASLEGPDPIPAINLGSLGGQSYAYALNNAGQVVGYSYLDEGTSSAGPYHAFSWKDGVMTDLGTLGGSNSVANDINAYGQVVGDAQVVINGRFSSHAFLWENGVMKDLGTLGQGTSSAKAINDSGQVVGNSNVVGSTSVRAFSWKDGVMTNLGTLGGTSSSYATALNASGQVIGTAWIAGNRAYHAFLWADGVMTDLGSLGGDSRPVAINDSGQVVGLSFLPGNRRYRAVLWQNGTMIDLGTPAEFNSAATDINASGEVVGWYLNEEGIINPFVWKDGVVTLLDAPSWTSPCSSPEINNDGLVAGCADTADGYQPFLWKDGVMTRLATLGGSEGLSFDLNDAGQVAGYTLMGGSDHRPRATLWNSDPTCIPVRLSEHNLFLLGDYTGGHLVEGRVAAGGDITLTDFAVGQAVPSGSSPPPLIAGRNLTLARGAVGGSAVHGGSSSADSTVSFPAGSGVSQGKPIDFEARFAELRVQSARLSRVPANGSTTRTPWGGVMLHGTDPQTNTFDVNASAFTGAVLLSIDAPAGSLAVVNIRGAEATFTGFGTTLSGGIQSRDILYNFVDAASLTASGYSFQGTVLAPYARVSFSNGSFEGGLYAVSLTGDAAGHLNVLEERDVCH